MKMVHKNNYSERLFLAKGKEDIYVNIEQLRQHQIEGIRFLYKQFIKKKSGVILNDPTGSGKTHQIVLFVNAIRGLLNKQPILILCGSHEKNHWLRHFQEFTAFGDGVLVEPANLNNKKMSICIDTKSNLASLASHHWSIIVVDDDSSINEVLKKRFKTDFKIWITSINMKSNLEAFWSIYGWLCPEGKKNSQDLFYHTKKTKDELAKLILLDAVMEDIVLRRANVLSQFKEQTININNKNTVLSGIKSKKTRAQSKIQIKSISNKQVENVLENVDHNPQINMNDNINFVINKTDQEQLRQEPMIATDEDIFLKPSPSSSKYECRDLDVVQSIENKCDVHSDISQDTKGTQIVNNETSKILCEQNILKEHIPCQPLSVDNLNIINDCKETDLLIDKQPLCDAECHKLTNKSSIYKNIDDSMKQMEEKALKKFKGSLLDSLF